MRFLLALPVVYMFGPLAYEFAKHDWRLGSLVVIGITAKILNGALKC